MFLAAEPHGSLPTNHCVPVYEVFSLSQDPDYPSLLFVMPFLVHWETPEFDTVGEAVEFFRQLLEVNEGFPQSYLMLIPLVQGLEFMHSLEVVHK